MSQKAEPEWTCEKCGSSDVEFSYPVWMPANNTEDVASWDPDWEASPQKDSDKTYCNQCEEHVFAKRNEAAG